MSTSLLEKKNHLLPDLFLSTHIPAPPEAELRVPTGAGEGNRAPASHGDLHAMGTRIPRGTTSHGDPHLTGTHISQGPTSHGDPHPTSPGATQGTSLQVFNLKAGKNALQLAIASFQAH